MSPIDIKSAVRTAESSGGQVVTWSLKEASTIADLWIAEIRRRQEAEANVGVAFTLARSELVVT